MTKNIQKILTIKYKNYILILVLILVFKYTEEQRTLKVHNMKEAIHAMSEIRIVPNKNKEFVLKREAVAHIDSKRCVNCGTCRELCPADAIQENQRTICRICPGCTDKPGMSPDAMDAFTTKQSCTTACPLGVSPQGYVNLVNCGKEKEAYELNWKKNPLPSVCSFICNHPCEEVCKRGALVDQPISIRGVKRFLSEHVDYVPEKYPRNYEERIAIIGAGPAGLAAGHFLSREGYDVTIFEGEAEAGGMLIKGIPEFRLDREALKRDISKLEEAGLEIKVNQRIGKFYLNKIKDEYDIVILAAGQPNGKLLKIPGHMNDAILTAMQFMQKANNDQTFVSCPGDFFRIKDGEGIIIGGGSVAMDVARAAVRLGAKNVTVVAVEEYANLPAHAWEVKEAEEEGVQVIGGYCPTEYVNGGGGTFDHVHFVKVKEMIKDENNKLQLVFDEKDSIDIRGDFAVVATGQEADKSWPESDDETFFYAGDISGESNCVIDAMASGRKTAYKVDAKLRGRTLRDMDVSHEIYAAPLNEKIYPANRRRVVTFERPVLKPGDRVNNFESVDLCYTEKQAKQEVTRCLSCGYEIVDVSKCIGCGICQKECPKGDVITMIAAEAQKGDII